jgi:hypothetical protein
MQLIELNTERLAQARQQASVAHETQQSMFLAPDPVLAHYLAGGE